MQAKTLADFKQHAIDAYPAECCGLVVSQGRKELYVRCANLAGEAQDSEHQGVKERVQFVMDHKDFQRAEDLGQVVALCHSHPDEAATPSHADKYECELMHEHGQGVPWFIVSVAKDMDGSTQCFDVQGFAPEGWQAPLIGRQFSHGRLDCWQLVRDWWKRERGIDIPDFEREDDWWHKGQDLYVDHVRDAGFEPMDSREPLQVGDLIVMQIRAPKANHGGVFIGNTRMLHHMHGYLSESTVYGGYWAEVTRFCARHRSML